MEERNVNTWEEFKKQLDDVRREHESLGVPELPPLFRGQENSCWLLSTTLDRKHERMPFRDYYRIIHRIQPQVEILTDHDWPIDEYPRIEELSRKYEFFNDLWCGRCPGYSYMAYLRHHGFRRLCSTGPARRTWRHSSRSIRLSRTRTKGYPFSCSPRCATECLGTIYLSSCAKDRT